MQAGPVGRIIDFGVLVVDVVVGDAVVVVVVVILAVLSKGQQT